MQRYSNRFRILLAVAVLLSLAVGMVAAATVTQSITYQGKLTDAAGNPLTGAYLVTFNLYEVSSAGSAIATETHSVTATKGLFTTQITAAPALFDGRALWLGIKVGADPEMTPRQELRPVPYALSLRPGAVITSNDITSVLNLQNTGGGKALNVYTTGSNSDGVSAVTNGQYSEGVSSATYGQYSDGISAYAEGDNSRGVFVTTRGRYSDGVSVSTNYDDSKGIDATTEGAKSPGVFAVTRGLISPGISAYTNGGWSNGVSANTIGEYSSGVYAHTTGSDSLGVYAHTTGTNSDGVYAYTIGIGSAGVNAISAQSNAIYAETGKADHKYGVETPDYMKALGFMIGASDVAEYMPVSGDETPGTVLVIGPDGKLLPSSLAYDTRVAGIISTAPGVFLGEKEDGNPGEQPIAVAGRVPCKVDASSAPIHAGDLLTTSDNSGYAMKAVPDVINGHNYYPDGTVLGKAMGNLESGTGTIEVLVTLQ